MRHWRVSTQVNSVLHDDPARAEECSPEIVRGANAPGGTNGGRRQALRPKAAAVPHGMNPLSDGGLSGRRAGPAGACLRRGTVSSRNSNFGKFNRGTLAAIPLRTVEFKREDLGGLW